MFLLTNRIGSYTLLANKPVSRYSGIFFREDKKVYKVIEDIKIDDRFDMVTSDSLSIERKYKHAKQKFFMPIGFNAIIYESNKGQFSEIILDCKESYDNRSFGRSYEIEIEDNKIIISFTKRTDSREDSTHDEVEYELFVVIKCEDTIYEAVEKWIEQSYDLDASRGSFPNNRFAFSALKIKTKKCVIAFSKDKKKAMHDADFVHKNMIHLKNIDKKYHSALLKPTNKKKGMAGRALRNSIISFDQLLVKREGLYAGLPWFFQFWARDQAICLKALSLIRKRASAKKILFQLLNTMQKDGNIPNRIPPTNLGCADAVGWVFVRAKDLMKKQPFISQERKFVTAKLGNAITRLLKYHTEEGFATNADQETWMDTKFRDDTRSGKRIEIQALRLFMYNFMYELSGKQYYKDLELRLKHKVQKEFWNEKTLADGLNDWTIRPNIFIAYYVYPKLLSKAQWIECFDNCLKHLWLDWGGLSTIEKHHPYYHDTYSGEVPDSYHRGDSWFWINNLAAICMHRLDKTHFKQKISQILEASTDEILNNGIIGSHAELSSAKDLKSEGCPAQAWSIALFIELMKEIK
ncbi:MAG: amylo-alpha-1,6-glucosidase [Candidatus Woesearchaeota archaeon]|nr:amylo-alpha-1,6-glucosidase [Candidatus Woesearchaeota archaeon]MDP7458003.1 amylo-alpha-1,6-glucosidase [Candidatus Woesearchaeota archaeon]